MFANLKRELVARYHSAGDSVRQARAALVGVIIAASSFVLSDWLALLFSDPKWTCTETMRWCGMAYQIIGVLYVVYGFNEARRMFDRPGLLGSIWLWIRNLRHIVLGKKPGVLSLSAHMNTGLDGVSATVTILPPNATLEEKVRALEGKVNEMEKNLVKARTEAEDLRREQTSALDREAQDRRLGDDASKDLIERAKIGSVSVDVVGVLFILVGIVLGTIPDVAASWFGVSCRFTPFHGA